MPDTLISKMEFFGFNLLTSITLFVFLLLLLVKMGRTICTPTRKRLPPGPWKFPIIGSLHHLVGSSLPHHTFRALAKKHGPIMHLQLGEIPTLVISSARHAQEVLKNHDLAVSNRPDFLIAKIIMYNSSDFVFSPYGDSWKQMKKICILELLSIKKVKSFSLVRGEEITHFIGTIRSSSGSPFDLGKNIFLLQNSIASRLIFGSKCKDQEEAVNLILDLVAYAGGMDLANLFPSSKLLSVLSGMMAKVKKTHKMADRMINDIIDEHIEKIRTSKIDEEVLVDALLRNYKDTCGLDCPLTIDNIKGIILDLFSGGTDTSSATMEWAMSEMIRNPRVLEKAQAEVRDVFKGKKVIDEADLQHCNYLKLVIKETLRLRNPFAFLLPRQTREQFEIDGYTIPEKTNIIVNFSAIARDPEYWDDAESFIPERFENSSIDFKGTDFEFIPFGAGRRMCPGMLFAMANIEIVLAQLLYNFDWKLPNGMGPKDLDMTELFGAIIKKKNSLSLVPTPYC